jgi:hypothetical protein
MGERWLSSRLAILTPQVIKDCLLLIASPNNACSGLAMSVFFGRLGAQRWSSHRNQVFNDGMKEMDQEDIKSKDGFDKASKTVAIIGGLISAIVLIISLSYKNARAWVMRTFRLDHNDGVDAQKQQRVTCR